MPQLRRARLFLEELETRTVPALFAPPATADSDPSGMVHIAGATPGVATQVAITTPPPASVASGNPFNLTVSVEDGFNNVVSSYNGSVTLSIANNPGTGTLGGTLTVNAVNGVATFTGLSLNQPGTGYILQAASTGLTSATTSAFNVTPDVPTQLAITSAPASSMSAGTSFGLTVAVEDAGGNVDPNYTGPVSLNLGTNPGNSTLQGTTTVNAVNGVATFTGLSLDTAASGYTIQASAPNLTNATTGSLTITANPATQLVIQTPPASSMAAGSTFGLTILAEDSFGNVNTTFNGPVALALSSNPGNATLQGYTTPVNAVNGVATFTGLSLDTAASGYTIQATSPNLTNAMTGSLTINPGPATQLAMTSEPPTTTSAGSSFGLTAKVEDSFGNVVSSYTGPVTLTLSSNPGNAALQGTTTVNAVNGVATFSGVSLETAASGYILQATGDSFSAQSSSLAITPAGPAQLVFTSPPPASMTAGTSFGATVQVKDAYGNLDSSYTGPVSVALASNPGNATLQGTTTVNAVNGVATFAGLSVNGAAGYTLRTSLGNLSTGSNFTVTPGTATQLAITTAPPSSLSTGNPFGMTAKLEDTFGNVVSSFTGPVSLSLASNPANGALQGATTVNAVNGVASFTGLLLDTAGSGYVLKASGSTFAAQTGSLTVAPSGPAQLTISSPPPASVTAGSTFGLTVQVKDPFGNLDTPYTGPVSLTLSSNPGNATLKGTTTVNAVNGVATFSGLSLTNASAGYVLQANLGSIAVRTAALTVTPAAPAQLLVLTQPPTSVTAGSSFGLKVEAKDSFGNVTTNYSGPVTLALSSNPGNGTLSGTLTVDAVNGVATFSSLSLSAVASGYTFKSSMGNLSVTTTSLSVTPSSTSHLAFATQPPAFVTAGAPFGFTVKVEDGSGDLVTSFNGTVTLAMGNNPGGSTLGGTVSVQAVDGVATFTGVTLNQLGSGYTIQVSSSGLAPTTTAGFNVAPDLVVTTEPPASLTAGSSFSMTVTAENASGHVFTNFSGPVTVALPNNSNNAALLGTPTILAHDGVATFTGLSIQKAAPSYLLLVTSDNWSTVSTSNSLMVTPAAASKLAIKAPPATVKAGTPFAMTVAVEDAYGNMITNATGSVGLALASNSANAALQGVTTATIHSGLATFSDLVLTKAGSGYSVRATAANLAAAASTGITVTPGAASALVVTPKSPLGVTSTLPFGFTVSAVDTYGNVVIGDSSPVTLALGSNASTVTLQGTTTVSAHSGVASFSGLTLTTKATSVALKATSGTLSAAVTANVAQPLYLYHFTLSAYNSSGTVLASTTYNPEAATDQGAQILLNSQLTAWGQQLKTVDKVNWSFLGDVFTGKTFI